ncbi:MAG: LytTR family DNA-binding domain-containing protein [Acidobacteriaceae bacterium]|nr:LytTR family DNA-binding domain-containing protein [Acidobacteriaceae bacterium]
MSMKVLIADDEALVRKSVRRLLLDHDVEIVAECEDGRSALDAIQQYAPDLVFLDIQMPELSGLEIIERLGEHRAPATIIITAYANFAVNAYEFNVVDYLLKPFGKERFDKAFLRASSRIVPASTVVAKKPLAEEPRVEKLLETLLQKYEHIDRIPVPKNGRVSLIETQRVEWFEARGSSLLLHCDHETHVLRKALSAMQKQLDPRYFIRIHRSTIVNIRFIREIQPWFNGHHIIILKNGQQLRMSRYRQESLDRLLGLNTELEQV